MSEILSYSQSQWDRLTDGGRNRVDAANARAYAESGWGEIHPNAQLEFHSVGGLFVDGLPFGEDEDAVYCQTCGRKKTCEVCDIGVDDD